MSRLRQTEVSLIIVTKVTVSSNSSPSTVTCVLKILPCTECLGAGSPTLRTDTGCCLVLFQMKHLHSRPDCLIARLDPAGLANILLTNFSFV